MSNPRSSVFSTIAALALLQAIAMPARAQHDLEIHMHLSKATALLGEPVWVDVSVTSRSREALFLDFGVACMGSKPLKVTIPSADPAIEEPRPCFGGIGGSCSSGGLPALQPGETLTRRYVFDGDFRITHPGSYEVQLEKAIRYAPVASSASDLGLSGPLVKQQLAKLTVEMKVEAPDPDKLLSLELALARTAMAQPAKPTLPSSPLDGRPLDKAAQKQAMDRFNEAELESLHLRDVIAEGLSKYPAAGMEQVFRGWVEDGYQFNTYGVLALKRLNTTAARDALAEIAESQARPNDTWFQSFRPQALDALVQLGDKTYVSLMERLLHDPSQSVQGSAVLGLGLLGGEKELDLLADSARNGSGLGAIRAIGYTASLRAVPLLIEFADLPGAGEPDVSYWSLKTLTHLDFPKPANQPIPEVKIEWTQFWNDHQSTAQAYGPYECSDRSPQGPNIVDIVKNLPTRVPELPAAEVSVRGNTVQAIYDIHDPANPKEVQMRLPVNLQLSSYSSEEEAERGVQMNLRTTSVSPLRKQTSGDMILYKWDQQRLMARIGLYVVSVQGGNPGSQQLIEKAFQSIVQQL